MKTIMKLDALNNLSDISNFLCGSQAILFTVLSDKDERYNQIEVILKRFNYAHLSRSDKGVLIKFLVKISGYSRQQHTRMIKRYLEYGFLRRHQKTTNSFERQYTDNDTRLLAKIDKLHDTPNGLRVKKLCERAYHKSGDKDFERLAKISVSHVYNLRQSKCYKNIRTTFTKTKSKPGSQIVIRKKPEPNGVPGFIRIDM
jgi:hypothetical protein